MYESNENQKKFRIYINTNKITIPVLADEIKAKIKQP